MQGRRNRKVPLSMLAWEKYPIRVCRWLNHCVVCCNDIVTGEQYRDGGYSRRAHVKCLRTKDCAGPEERSHQR